MKTRYLIFATLAAGLSIFLWESVWHVANPMYEKAVLPFKDDRAFVESVRTQAPVNGIYLAPQGVFASVSMTPDLADKTQMMGTFLVRQVLIDILVGFLLSLALLRTQIRSPLKAAGFILLLAVAAGVHRILPQWNWYGFSLLFSALEFLGLVIGWGLAGLVIGALRRRLDPVN
jgi:hypothetical protein